MPSGTFHAGLRAGGRVRKVELSLTGGILADASFTPKVAPFYLTIGSAYSF